MHLAYNQSNAQLVPNLKVLLKGICNTILNVLFKGSTCGYPTLSSQLIVVHFELLSIVYFSNEN